jgi:chorismate-pyruvate lyase
MPGGGRTHQPRPLEIEAVDPLLREVLFTDGALTRALEAHTLRRVSVDVLDESLLPTPSEQARWLKIAPREASIRRRVLIKLESLPTPVVYAESYLLPRRLPLDFMQTLARSLRGIGEAIQLLCLEMMREVLWCGLGRLGEWAAILDSSDRLVRFSRLIIDRSPAIVVTEAFNIERAGANYRLANVP